MQNGNYMQYKLLSSTSLFIISLPKHQSLQKKKNSKLDVLKKWGPTKLVSEGNLLCAVVFS